MLSPSDPLQLPESVSNHQSPEPLSHEERVQIANNAWMSCQGLQNEEDIPDSSKGLPLKDLIVHVEMFTNGINISEASYGYLTKLGAKVEKRMNKKCNLVIWKDGSLKTINKAKEYGAHVVNSLWLEDCIENDSCSPFEKYYPALPNESDLPFITSLHENKGKRRAFEAFGSKSFDFNIENHTTKKTDNANRKKRKTNLEENTTRIPLQELKPRVSFNSFTQEPRTFGTGLENILKAAASMENPDTSPFYFQRLQKDLTSPKEFDENLSDGMDSLDQDPNKPKENGESNRVKNLIRKYTSQNLDSSTSKKETYLMPIKADTRLIPEEKKEKQQVALLKSKTTPFFDDISSVSEESFYESRTTNFAPIIKEEKQNKNPNFKVDLNKIFAKYLQPKTLESSPVGKETEEKGNDEIGYHEEEESKGVTPQKMNSWDARKKQTMTDSGDSGDSSLTKETKTRCTTIEKSSLIRKYLNAQKEIGISAEGAPTSFASGTEFKAREIEEKNSVKTFFGRRKQIKETHVDSSKVIEDDIEPTPWNINYSDEKPSARNIEKKFISYQSEGLRQKQPQSFKTSKTFIRKTLFMN